MFEYDFIRNSLLIGIIIGFMLPSIGVLVMLRRMSFIADSFGHINMSGIAFAMYIVSVLPILFNFQLIIVLLWTIISALLIEFLREKYDNYKELSIVVVYSLSIVLTIIFLNINSGYKSSILSILFGNINAISDQELIFAMISSVIILVVGIFKYKNFLILAIEENYAKIYNVDPKVYRYLTMIIIALSITIAIKSVGVLLVSSLLIIPLMSAANISNSLKNTWIYGIIFTEYSILFGIIASFKMNIPASALIVAMAIMIYIITLLKKNLGKK